MVTTGGEQGIELACKALCNPGDAVLCEEPSFIGALNSFRSLGAVPVGVPMDADGINVEAFEEAAVRTGAKARLSHSDLSEPERDNHERGEAPRCL